MSPLSNNPSRSPLGAFYRSPLGVFASKPYIMTMAFVSMTEYSLYGDTNSWNSYSVNHAEGRNRWDADIVSWNQKIADSGMSGLHCEIDLITDGFYDYAEWTYRPNDIDYVYMYTGDSVTIKIANLNIYDVYDSVLNDEWDEYTFYPSGQVPGFYNPSGITTARNAPTMVNILIEDSPNMNRTSIATALNYFENYLDGEGISWSETVYTTTEDDDETQGRWLQWFL